jgi:hypothetical protein
VSQNLNREVEGGGGATIPPLFFSKGSFNKIKREVDEAVEKFWGKDQISGFNEHGERIGTGIPRVKPSYLRDNEYTI